MGLIFIRLIFVLICSAAGYQISSIMEMPSSVIGTAIGFLLGLFMVGLELSLRQFSLKALAAGTIGLLSGLLVGNLLASPFYFLKLGGKASPILPLCFNLICGYFGMALALKRKADILPLINLKKASGSAGLQILDTSVIIDGRIADICETGFLEGSLIIPRFVLREAQGIADSLDSLKRKRGRRGLEILNKLQKNANTEVIIKDEEYPEIREVDAKLVKMAKDVNAKVVTNDYNLNKIAELQEVKVLNINDLANALRPVFLPGEPMRIRLVKEGKEADQAIGYLDDGTMVVVDNSRRYIGREANVYVTSVLQTTAGRMIFARLKEGTSA